MAIRYAAPTQRQRLREGRWLRAQGLSPSCSRDLGESRALRADSRTVRTAPQRWWDQPADCPFLRERPGRHPRKCRGPRSCLREHPDRPRHPNSRYPFHTQPSTPTFRARCPDGLSQWPSLIQLPRHRFNSYDDRRRVEPPSGQFPPFHAQGMPDAVDDPHAEGDNCVEAGDARSGYRALRWSHCAARRMRSVALVRRSFSMMCAR